MDRIDFPEGIYSKVDINWDQIYMYFQDIMYIIDVTTDCYIIEFYYGSNKSFILEDGNYEYTFLTKHNIILKTKYVDDKLLIIWRDVKDPIDAIINNKLDNDFKKVINTVLHYIFRKKTLYLN